MQGKARFFSLFVLCLMCVGFPGSQRLTFAQVTTGTIQGTVKDEQGAIIPGVEITIRNLDTGVARTLVSDDQGRYLASDLGLGNFEVRAELAGFQAAVRRGITLTIGQVAAVDLALQVGEVTEEVVVMGEAPLVETTQSSIAQVVDDKKIRDLPLNVRSYAELATLQVGVTKFKIFSGPMNGIGVQLSFAGSRPDSNAYLLDGADINNVYNKAPNSGTGGIIGVEAVREFQVLTNTYSAQFGRSMGGQLVAVTRSGTNAFHGSAYEFYRNDNLDARNFFDDEKPEFKRNQFGFSLGGPIIKDKTFFFGNYEGFREALGVTTISTVPDERARQGILPGRSPFEVHPAVKPYLANLDLFPLPNGRNFNNGLAEYIFDQTQPTSEDMFMARVDHNFSDADSFFVRHSFNDGERLVPAARANFGREETGVRNYFTTLEEKHIFSPQTLNIFRFSFNRQLYTLIDPDQVKIPRELWFNDLAKPPQQPMGTISITGGGGVSSGIWYPRFFALNLFEFSNDLSYVTGGHSLKFGGLAKRIQYNFRSALYLKGEYQFNSIEDFLRGRPARTFRSQRPDADGYRGMRMSLFGFYIQDDYKMRPNLTWNLGLRYEFITVPTEVNGKVANLHNILDPEPTVGDPFFENPSLRSFAPRIGFAWDPFADGKTSIRGGYGIYFNQILYNVWNHASYSQPPFFLTGFINNARFPDAFKDILAGGTLRTAETVEGKFGPTYLQQWNLSVERQLLSQTAVQLGYVGARGVHLGRLTDNLAYPARTSDGRWFIPVENQNKRRNPGFAEIRQRKMDANSFYNALVAGFRKRYSQGFDMQVSYTLSKSIDDASTLIGGAEVSGGQSQWTTLIENPAFDRGFSLFHTAHNFVFNTTWELPFGPGRPFGSNLSGLSAKLLGGWAMSNIVSLASGSPVTIEIGFNNPRDGRNGGQAIRPDLVHGRSNNPVLGGPDRYFDVSSFTLPPVGFYGNLAKGTLIGPGDATWDVSLVKNTRLSNISEEFNIQFRAEFFNILNRANFAYPERTVFPTANGIPNPIAGRITDTSTSSRQIQFALKLLW